MIPRTPATIKDIAIGGAFIAISVVVPGTPMLTNFSTYIGGIALGIGLGWIIKSVIDHTKGVSSEQK